MNATNVVTQTLNLLGKGVEDIEAALQSTRPGAEGLTFFPFLNGERTPDLPHARGSIVGASANNFTTSNLIRAVIEGVSFGILNGLDLIMEGKLANTIAVIGGGARSREWRQLLADATGATIQMPAEEEAGCLGAAMQAMYAHGQVSGNKDTYVEIANRCVRVQNSAGEEPRSTMQEGFRRARENYRQSLEGLYLRRN